ncbi:hypothetical protein ACJJTC_001708 [Scirpophaga incertulas]
MSNEIDKVLNEMALCDFRSPMYVTITIEDSDDEEKVVKESKKSTIDNFYECPTPKISEHYSLLKAVLNSPVRINKNLQTFTESERKRHILIDQITDDNSKSKQIKQSKHSEKNIGKDKKCAYDNCYECCSKDLIKDSVKRPLSFDEITGQTFTEIKRKRNSSTDQIILEYNSKSERIKDTTDRKNPLEEKSTISTDLTGHVGNVTSKQKQDSVNTQTENKESNAPNKILKNINTNSLRQINEKKDDKINEVNNYVENLLTKVSKALLYAMDAYYIHIGNVMKRQNDTLFIQNSKRRYERIKQHYFQLAYCTTDTIILPQENNDEFTQEFLKNTIKIAQELTMKTLTLQEVQPFYYDLILWVKNMKKKTVELSPSSLLRDKTPVQQQPQYHTIVPVEELNIAQIPKQSEYDPVVTVEKFNTLSPCSNTIHNAHIKIAIEPRIPPCQNTQHITRNIAPKSLSSDVRKTDPKTFYNDQERYRLENNSQTDILYNFRKDVPNQVNVYTHNISNNVLGQYAYGSNTDRVNSFTKIPPYQPPPNNAQIHSFSSPQAIYGSNLNGNYVTQTAKNADTYTECQRSTSTDSGILSPFSQGDIENVENQQFTPIITHVTSLNPNVLRLVKGQCHVCGKMTDKKCLQCYGSYYCSYNCQSTDWTTHRYQCGLLAVRNRI